MTYAATGEQINALRLIVGEHPADESGYSDYDLAQAIENRSGDLHAAAGDVWMWKAAAASSLIDWSADGGSYKQAALYDRYRANAMEEYAQSPATGGMIIDPTLPQRAA